MMGAVAERQYQETNVIELSVKFKVAYDNYMNTMKNNSLATYKNYRSHFNMFFDFNLSKNPDTDVITWDDILSIKFVDVEGYQNYLCDVKNNSPQVINQKISEIRALWEYLVNHNEDVNPNIFNVLPRKVMSKPKGAHALSEDEMVSLIQFAGNRKFKPEVQMVFFRFAAITGFRKEALLSLTWDKIKRIRDFKSKQVFWVVQDIYDKTGERTVPIGDKLYDELVGVREDTGGKDGRLFCVGEDTLNDTLKAFKKEFELEKRISFHSLRKTSSDMAYLIAGGDLRRVMQQTGHKNPNTVLGTYTGTDLNLSDHPGLMMFQDLDVKGALEGLGRDELIEIVLKCSKSTQREIVEMVGKV